MNARAFCIVLFAHRVSALQSEKTAFATSSEYIIGKNLANNKYLKFAIVQKISYAPLSIGEGQLNSYGYLC